MDVSDEEIAKYGARASLREFLEKTTSQLWMTQSQLGSLNQIQEIKFWISEQCIRILKSGDINSKRADFISQLREKDRETLDRYRGEYSDNLNKEIDLVLEQKRISESDFNEEIGRREATIFRVIENRNGTIFCTNEISTHVLGILEKNPENSQIIAE